MHANEAPAYKMSFKQYWLSEMRYWWITEGEFVSSNHNKEKYRARMKKHGFVSAKRNQEILVIVFLGGYTRWII